MKDQIISLKSEFFEKLERSDTPENLEELRLKFFGKKGCVTTMLKSLGKLLPEERSAIGKTLNDFRREARLELEQKSKKLEEATLSEQMLREWVDVTVDKTPFTAGSLHPVTLVQYRLEDIFTAMGFTVLDGPHVETEYYNFEALNIQASHPARDLQDTFFLQNGQLLRTQTSTIQIRGMERYSPPFRFVGPGKVFRAERTDSSHDSVFHQFEGMLVDKDISVANLIHFMKTTLREVLEDDSVNIRLRPGYFPFVEPGFELDISCQICRSMKDKDRCKACKGVGWLELLGCGMTHPAVLRGGNIDPHIYSGFAFGMGLDRLAMMKYGIDDIRLLHSGDIRFARQFAAIQIP